MSYYRSRRTTLSSAQKTRPPMLLSSRQGWPYAQIAPMLSDSFDEALALARRRKPAQ